MRYIGVFLLIIGIFMVLAGLSSPTVCFLSLVPFIGGALLFSAAQRRDKKADDDRKHAEMMEAIRQSKQ